MLAPAGVEVVAYERLADLPAFNPDLEGREGEAVGLGAGVAMGQLMAQQLQQGLAGAAKGSAEVKPVDVMATIERLHDMQTKGILSAEEFNAKKAELLKKLT